MKTNTSVIESSVTYRRLTVGVNGQGTTNPPPDTYTYPHGARVTITSLPAQGWRFDRWHGALSGNSSVHTVIMNSNKNVTASFVAYRRLTIGIYGQGTTYPAPDTYTYPHGARVNITASPAQGWRFDRWLGALSGNSPVRTIIMNADKNVAASFVAYRRLTVGVNGQGTTNPPPDTYTYPHGARVTITALPAQGWRFNRWHGALSGNSSVHTAIMNSNKNVTASFVAYRELKKETKPEPSYIANRNSKEIHKSDCLWVTRMKEENKIPCSNLNDVAEMISNKEYNGCFYCLTRYDRDTLTLQQVLNNLEADLLAQSQG